MSSLSSNPFHATNQLMWLVWNPSFPASDDSNGVTFAAIVQIVPAWSGNTSVSCMLLSFPDLTTKYSWKFPAGVLCMYNISYLSLEYLGTLLSLLMAHKRYHGVFWGLPLSYHFDRPCREMPQVLCQGFQGLPFPQFPKMVLIDFCQKSEEGFQISSFNPWGPRSGSWSARDAWLLPTGWLFSLETPQHNIEIIVADHPLACSYGLVPRWAHWVTVPL